MWYAARGVLEVGFEAREVRTLGGAGISKVAERLKRLRKGLGWEEMEWEVQLTYLVSPAFGQVL